MEFRIKELKQRLKITNKQIAHDMKVSSAAVDSWTSGNRTPRPSSIALMEKTYGLNPGWITGENDNMYIANNARNKKNQIKEIMICKTDFAVDTVYKLTQASDSDWSAIEKILK